MAALFADQKERALELIEERLATEPANTQCLIQLAECLFALGRRDEALAAADTAAESAADIPEALDAIGAFLGFANDHTKALRLYDRAVAIAPEDPTLWAKRADIHQFLGHFELAVSDHEKALALAPNHAESLKGLAELRRQTADGNVVALMERALAAVPPDSRDAAALHFGLAKTYEDLGEYPRSWQHLSVANKLERARLKYAPKDDRDTIEHIIAAFPNIEVLGPDTTGESPIFIVGMPRTGTTLVERIIGNHSTVHSAGELAAFGDAVATIAVAHAPQIATTWLGITDTMGSLDGKAIASEYLQRARARRGDRPRFSDKAPANFFYCALIFRAFPNARIVHLTRHPMATGYAIFKTRFAGGYPFAYDLRELGAFFANYRRLMAHWHRILPGRILDLPYEQVVTDQEATTRRLLDYLGLPFEAACLDFHMNPDATSTASSVQVRQPLYDSSLELWRHYTKELEPLREALSAGGVPAEQLD
jgi:tetratricopeptide (TPR) repeat protein